MKLHPKFLEVLGQLQPLIVVISLCIMIAAFSHGVSQSTAQYALYAAVCFFLSLIFSIITRIRFYPDNPEGSHYTVAAYLMTALGFVFLFTVILSFQEIVPYVSKLIKFSIYIVIAMFLISIFRFNLTPLWRILEEKRYEGIVEKIFVCYLWGLAIITGGLIILTGAIDMLDGWEKTEWLMIITFAFFLASLIPTSIFYVKEDKGNIT